MERIRRKGRRKKKEMKKGGWIRKRVVMEWIILSIITASRVSRISQER